MPANDANAPIRSPPPTGVTHPSRRLTRPCSHVLQEVADLGMATYVKCLEGNGDTVQVNGRVVLSRARRG